MKPSEIAHALGHLIDIKRPVFLWGPPGAGKSDVVAQVAASRELELRDVRLSLLDPTDLKGFPAPDLKAGLMRWLPADFLPTTGNGVLFLDEMNSAPPSVQAAGYQLVLNRRIGDYHLPPGWSIVAAGNRDSDRSVVHRMPAALANRLVHLDFEVDTEDFVNWAMDNGVSAEQIAFHRFRSNLIHQFDPAQNPRAFPSPRSWYFVHQIVSAKNKLPQSLEYNVVAGAVGDGAAAEYYGFLKAITDLPSVTDIRKSPDKTKVPNEPSTLYALTTGLAMGTKDDKDFDLLMKYVKRIPVEFQVVYVKDVLRRVTDIRTSVAFTKWSIENANVMGV